MVDSSVSDVELADIVRRFGPQYTSQYGHGQQRRGVARTGREPVSSLVVMPAVLFFGTCLPGAVRRMPSQ